MNASRPPSSRRARVARALVTVASTLSRLRTMRGSASSRASVGGVERRDHLGVEAVEDLAEGLALVQDRRPRQPRLEGLERQPLEVGRLAADRAAPLLVVVVAHGARPAPPRAAREPVLTDLRVPRRRLSTPRRRAFGSARCRDGRGRVVDRDAEAGRRAGARRRPGPARRRGRPRPPRGCGPRSSTTSRSPRRTAGHRGPAAAHRLVARASGSRAAAGRHVDQLVRLRRRDRPRRRGRGRAARRARGPARRRGPGGRRARAAARRRAAGVAVGTGLVEPSSEPRKTRASHPGPVTGGGAKWVKPGSPSRAASGSATHSCAPCRVVVAGVETSEWLMPWPAVIRLSSPGRTVAWCPALSRCSISPVKSQLTVCRPVCGWGGTTMPPVSATSSGP